MIPMRVSRLIPTLLMFATFLAITLAAFAVLVAIRELIG